MSPPRDSLRDVLGAHLDRAEADAQAERKAAAMLDRAPLQERLEDVRALPDDASAREPTSSERQEHIVLEPPVAATPGRDTARKIKIDPRFDPRLLETEVQVRPEPPPRRAVVAASIAAAVLLVAVAVFATTRGGGIDAPATSPAAGDLETAAPPAPSAASPPRAAAAPATSATATPATSAAAPEDGAPTSGSANPSALTSKPTAAPGTRPSDAAPSPRPPRSAEPRAPAPPSARPPDAPPAASSFKPLGGAGPSY